MKYDGGAHPEGFPITIVIMIIIIVIVVVVIIILTTLKHQAPCWTLSALPCV